MLSWILQTTILSIVFIFIIHHLIIFFKDNLTIPKIKDLVHAPSQKYNEMYNIISSKKEFKKEEVQEEVIQEVIQEVDVMKNELKNFLKEQLHGKSNNNYISTTNIDDLDNYASF